MRDANSMKIAMWFPMTTPTPSRKPSRTTILRDGAISSDTYLQVVGVALELVEHLAYLITFT